VDVGIVALLATKGTFSENEWGGGRIGRVLEMSREEFEDLVAEALDEIPDELARLVDNVVFVVEDDGPEGEEPLLGLYEGVPLTERGSWYAGVLPDRITIYRNPILEICDTEDDVVDEVHITVVHEIAHHFGIDDDRLHDLGYD
jgi:predicted Zn-dependent protease with MMP-like domain